jgi:P27 family predicted phage terminase small subunit
MRTGPKPKPTKLKVLEGNPGRRRLPKGEPQPRIGAPKAPTWLDPIARREWSRVVPELEAIGLLTQVDGFVLEAYCQCYSRWVQAEEVITRLGVVYQPSKKADSKYLQQLPHVSIAQRYLAEARAFAEQLGLSPSARSRIDVPGRVPARESDDDLLD